MTFVDLFRPVSEWTVERLREYLGHHHPEDYQLVDVRRLSEYGERHLPGAVWIPGEELSQRVTELDPELPTIVYCRSGVRSRAGVTVLARAGFNDVHNLHGGILAWHGHVARGLPEASNDHFLAAKSAADQVILAWLLEENARRFYTEMADTLESPTIAARFAELASAENHHKSMLVSVWEGLSGENAASDFPAGKLVVVEDDLMEGGMRLGEVLEWASDKAPDEILELAMSIEMNAYDHYLHLYRFAGDDDTKRVFEVIAVEERHHLNDLGLLLEKNISPY